jgi:hypothetical protein
MHREHVERTWSEVVTALAVMMRSTERSWQQHEALLGRGQFHDCEVQARIPRRHRPSTNAASIARPLPTAADQWHHPPRRPARTSKRRPLSTSRRLYTAAAPLRS